MPSKNPRINLTVSPQQYELISRLAQHQSISRSALIMDTLEMVFPVLERVCVVLDAAKTAKETSKEGLRDSIAKAEADLLPMLYQAVNQLDIFIDDAAASLGVPSDSLGQSHAAIGKAMMGAISDPEGGSGATHSGRKAPSINPRPVIRGSGIKNRGGKP